jgi:uncharacterized protein
MAIALVAAALINGESLVRTAEREPYGASRDIAVTAARPARFVSDVFRLDLPRRMFESMIDHQELEAGSEFGGGLLPTAPPTTTGDAIPQSPAPVPAVATPTEPPRPQHRRPTVADPLRVLFAGDSLIGNIATAFGRVHSAEQRMLLDVDFHVSTGLARPDVLDWPTYLDRIVGERDPEVVVLMFGGNDDQDMQTEDGKVPLFSPEWVREYQRRVGIMMDVAGAEDRTVVWLGLPAVQVERLESARRLMNRAARQQARERWNVRYVNLAATLTPDGYDQYVQDVRAREADGVHLSIPGSELVAHDILDAFARARRLG